LFDMFDGLLMERRGGSTIERTDQLLNYAEKIGETVIAQYLELEQLAELKPLAEQYQSIDMDSACIDKLEDRMRMLVAAEDDYCLRISALKKKYDLKHAYVFA
jgi:hypothetical protein